jgi:hypothetical protein
MRNLTRYLAVLSLAASCACVAAAQDMPANGATIPKVLQITREWLKPGKAGMVHDKSESAFVDAMAKAKWPTHYIALTSLSGKPRALYLSQYASFDAWQKDNDGVMKNAALMATLDRDVVADGELLDSLDQAVFIFHDEMSLRPRADLSQMRYMEASLYHVRPGKDAVWSEVVKMAKDGYEKASPDAHWGMFEQVYGGDGGTYLLLSSHKAMAEIDKGFGDDKAFETALGAEGMKKFSELYAECCEISQHQLFAFSSAQSYVPDEWIKASPDFWKRKPMAPPAEKMPPAEKKPTP